MGGTAHRWTIGDAPGTGAAWQATATQLARKLQALQRRLDAVERALGCPTPPRPPDPCCCRCGRGEASSDCPQPAPASPLPPHATPLAAPTRTGGLSRREAEVLQLLAMGRSNREIARALYLSPRTVQCHIANLYLKIGAHNTAEATAYALRHGLG